MLVPLEFERPVLELEAKIDELNQLTGNDDLNIAEEIAELRSKAEKLLVQTYSKLSPWQRVQVARHPGRPRLTHFVEGADRGVPAALGRPGVSRRCSCHRRHRTVPGPLRSRAGAGEGR